MGVTAGPSLLALAADVEQRVVDPDGQADEDDYRCSGAALRGEVRDQAERAERAGHRGQAQQERDDRGHEGAEGDDEDEQRDRQRHELGLMEVVVEDVIDGAAAGSVAGLLQLGARMSGGHGASRPLERDDVIRSLVGIAAQRDLHELEPSAGP